jgi:hypothetical protein
MLNPFIIFNLLEGVKFFYLCLSVFQNDIDYVNDEKTIQRYKKYFKLPTLWLLLWKYDVLIIFTKKLRT